jgi:CTP synthase (UTP-ammonia lyase)
MLKYLHNLVKRISIGLVGDFNEKIHTLVALDRSVAHVSANLGIQVDATWIPTQTITKAVFDTVKFHGFWIVPGSPYVNDVAVYNVIRWARENDFPILGSCGGFQYMIIEYARNVLGWCSASHGETDPESAQQVIRKLTCSLKGRSEEVLITDRHSWLYKIIQKEKITGHFYCSYGLDPGYLKDLDKYPFVFTAFSAGGDARALELKGHRFYNGTLFQPSLDSTPENPNPLIMDFIRRCGG